MERKRKRSFAHLIPDRKRLIKKLDLLVRKILLIRDSIGGSMFRCISCGKLLPIEKAQAGHYASRRYLAIRWDLDNVHLQCAYCNGFLKGNLILYRKRLIEKIGLEAVERLEMIYREPSGYSLFDLECLYAELKKKHEELRKVKE